MTGRGISGVLLVLIKYTFTNSAARTGLARISAKRSMNESGIGINPSHGAISRFS